MPSFKAVVLCLLLVALFSSASFAAAPDRIAGPVVAQQTIRLAAGVPMQARPEFDMGPVDPSFKLNYITLLTVPSASQRKALDRLLAQQQDPRSANYHRWLTPEEYADRFGLSANDVKKLTTWLQSQGFSIVSVARGRNWIVFRGTAAQVENAFHTQIHQFEVNGETHFSNVTPPSIPAALAGVASGFRGLNNFRLQSHVQRFNPDYALTVSGSTFQFLGPGDLSNIYDIGPLYSAGIDGTGLPLAVIGQTDVFLADLTEFRSGFNLSPIVGCTANTSGVLSACNTSNFQYVLVGTTDPLSPIGDVVEADLDIEWSGAIARNAQIIYVNAPALEGLSVIDALYYAIDNDLAPVMTMSYGICELGEAQNGAFPSDEAELAKSNAQGITFLNSTGDRGSAECDFSPPNSTRPFLGAQFGLSVSYPASSPSVTGVGGTMIPMGEYSSTYWNTNNDSFGGSALGYIPENGWNDDSELGAYCAAHSTVSFCKPPSPGVPVKDAKTFQQDYWISIGGGGASNCTNFDAVTGWCAANTGFPQPAWQTVTVPNQASARFSPDISLLASASFPGYIFCTQGSCASGINNAILGCVSNSSPNCSVVGGTSASSPVFAGMVTLLNQYLVQNSFQGTPGLGNANPALYQMAIYNQSAFHPVTAGLNAPNSNTVYCQVGLPTGAPNACPAAGSFGYLSANADATTGYNLVTGLGSVDLGNLATAWGQLLTPLTTFTIAPSAAQIYEAQSVTFNAAITPTAASGIVSFFNNGSATALGTAALSGGSAHFATTSLPLGTNNVTGSYTGTNMSSTTVAPATVTVLAPTFNWSPSGGTTVTLLAGQSATYAFTVTPTSTPTFTSAVTFACSGLPNAAACTFTPPTIAAGAGSMPVGLTISTAGPNTGTVAAVQRRRADNRAPWLPLTVPLAGIVAVGIAGRRVPRRFTIAGLCVSLALLGLLLACGGGSHPPVGISINPSTAVSLYFNEAGNSWPAAATQQKFTAAVSNATNTGVTWQVNGVTGGNATFGTIDNTGLYTAPAALPSPASFRVTAVAQADTSKAASTQMNILTPTTLGAANVVVTAQEASTANQQGVTLTVQ